MHVEIRDSWWTLEFFWTEKNAWASLLAFYFNKMSVNCTLLFQGYKRSELKGKCFLPLLQLIKCKQQCENCFLVTKSNACSTFWTVSMYKSKTRKSHAKFIEFKSNIPYWITDLIEKWTADGVSSFFVWVGDFP